MISIIIPCLNEEKYLPRLLRSIQSQDFLNFEIIISDGNSKDATLEIAKKYKCKIITSKKRSPAHQRNSGAKIAKGRILLFLDADTILPKKFLSCVTKEFSKKNLDIAGFYFKPDSCKLIYKFYSHIYKDICRPAQYIKPVSMGAGIMIKTKLHKKIKGFDTSIIIGEDHDYVQRACKISKFRIIKSSKIFYSVRRFEKHGAFKTLIRWIYCIIYVLIKGPIKKQVINYEFGNN
ncbi:hypothetical protein CL633_00950 [bacterium]|nr:hypothetical protein [bacterium]|tara:strand:- start:7339 stop:8040 length:702 start_codon:yes stop_codon:yes gene_type:complete